MIADHIGMVYSGLGPDYRLLVKRARKIAQQYWLTYGESIPTTQLVQKVIIIIPVFDYSSLGVELWCTSQITLRMLGSMQYRFTSFWDFLVEPSHCKRFNLFHE